MIVQPDLSKWQNYLVNDKKKYSEEGSSLALNSLNSRQLAAEFMFKRTLNVAHLIHLLENYYAIRGQIPSKARTNALNALLGNDKTAQILAYTDALSAADVESLDKSVHSMSSIDDSSKHTKQHMSHAERELHNKLMRLKVDIKPILAILEETVVDEFQEHLSDRILAFKIPSIKAMLAYEPGAKQRILMLSKSYY
jgi:hypothetical protein